MTFQSMCTVHAAMAHRCGHTWRSNRWAPRGLLYLLCRAIPSPILMLLGTVHLSSLCLAVSSGANCQEGSLLSLVKTGLSRTTVGLAPIYELVNSCMWDWLHLPHHTLTSARYMHPGTPHIVITTSNCVAYGAHFYNLNVLHCTFAAMVAEHFVGRNAANTEHMRAPLLLFKGLDAILEEHTTFYGGEGWPAFCQSLSPGILTGTVGVLTIVLSDIEHLRNLAWLILLIHYLPQLAPRVPKNAPDSGNIWQESPEFADDHSYIEDRAQILYDLCCAENHGGSRFEEILCRIETWAWHTIQRFQQNQAKHIPPKHRVKPVCICKMHQVNSTFLCTKLSDLQVLENAQPEDDDFYSYPYASLPTLGVD